jgi:hypothetical protein
VALPLDAAALPLQAALLLTRAALPLAQIHEFTIQKLPKEK